MNLLAPRVAQDPPPVGAMLHRGLEVVEDLARKLQALDDLMLTGRPHDIAAAALSVENALRDAAPSFSAISSAMEGLGARNLEIAARQLRASEDAAAAGLADALRLALGRFAKRSAAANRRAQQLNRGLGTALRALQALGLEDNGRLIAEA